MLRAALSILEVNWRPSRSQLRSFAAVAVLAFGALGCIAWAGPVSAAALPRHVPSIAAWTATAWAAVGLCEPTWALPLYRLLTAISLPFGLLSAWLFLLLLFFGVITPVALLRRFLRRSSHTTQGSAWLECRQPTDKSDYFRQF
jgi:hypothetical protein